MSRNSLRQSTVHTSFGQSSSVIILSMAADPSRHTKTRSCVAPRRPQRDTASREKKKKNDESRPDTGSAISLRWSGETRCRLPSSKYMTVHPCHKDARRPLPRTVEHTPGTHAPRQRPCDLYDPHEGSDREDLPHPPRHTERLSQQMKCPERRAALKRTSEVPLTPSSVAEIGARLLRAAIHVLLDSMFCKPKTWKTHPAVEASLYPCQRTLVSIRRSCSPTDHQEEQASQGRGRQ